MMSWFRDLPIRTKLMVLMAGTSSVILVLVCVVFVVSDVRSIRMSMVDRHRTMADLLANNSAAALDFGDPTFARELLGTLRSESSISCATLYDAAGTEFARYTATGARHAPPAEIQAVGHYFDDDGYLVVVQPVLRGETPIGAIHLRARPEEANVRVRQILLVAALLLAGSLIVVVLLGALLQRVISQPIDALAQAAEKVTRQADYGVRVSMQRKDELGILCQAFNSMLAQIQQRDAELVAKSEQLVAANDELEQFMFTVSHDLKSPLVTATGFLGMLKEDAADGNSEDVLDSAQRLERAIKRMSTLLDDLLEFSRVGRIRHDPEEVDTVALVKQVADDLADRIREAGVQLIVEEDIPPVYVDRVRMLEIVENLLTNALKYGCTDPHPVIRVGGQVRDDEVRVFVQDNGCGIDPQYHARIFQLFQRLESDKRGTGVGLAAVSRIMNVHQGRVWVESNSGKGATFWLGFPKAVVPPGK